MAETNIIGYKKIFGIILPNWVTEKMIRYFVFGVFCVVAMGLVLLLVIKPKNEQVVELRRRLEADKLALEELRASRDGILRMTTDLSDKELENIMLAMPLEYSPERAIFVLRQIAADTGVSIVSYSLPSGVIVESSESKLAKTSDKMIDFSTYLIKITLSGPVEQLLSFITKVESSLPFGLVSDMNLQEVTKLTKSSSGKSVQIALELKYFQPKVNPININKIEVLSAKNLENARSLAGYNLFVLPENSAFGAESASVSGSLFGL